MRKPLPNALDIDFTGGLTSEVTPHAGIALFLETGRRTGIMAAAEKYLRPKRSPKRLGQDQMVEAFVLLSALGGDCLDGFEGLRRDQGLAALLGYTLPAAATARQWLDRFHDEALPWDTMRTQSAPGSKRLASRGRRGCGSPRRAVPPALDPDQQAALSSAVETPPAAAGIAAARWSWRSVRARASGSAPNA